MFWSCSSDVGAVYYVYYMVDLPSAEDRNSDDSTNPKRTSDVETVPVRGGRCCLFSLVMHACKSGPSTVGIFFDLWVKPGGCFKSSLVTGCWGSDWVSGGATWRLPSAADWPDSCYSPPLSSSVLESGEGQLYPSKGAARISCRHSYTPLWNGELFVSASPNVGPAVIFLGKTISNWYILYIGIFFCILLVAL